jgi:pentatricopeptide repeat protein
MIVCRVLKKMPKSVAARRFFNWAKSKRGYKHNMYTYTALIDYYGRTKNYAAIEEVLTEMCEVGCGMSIVTFSQVIHWYRESKNLAGVRRVWEHMKREGCRPNEYTYTTYIDALAKGGCPQEALEVFKEMQDSECQPNMFTYNVLIHSLVEAGKLDSACEMFNKLLELQQRPNFVTYTILVTAHEKAGDLEKAVYFFQKMMESGFLPSHALRSLLFKALTTKGRETEVAELTPMCTAMGARIEKRKSNPADGIHELPPSPMKLAELLLRWGPGTDSALETLTPNLPSQYLSNVLTRLSNDPEVAWRFFKWLRSQEALEPSKYVFAKVMDILGKAGHVDMQLEVLADAEAAKAANAVLYNTLIHSYCTAKRTDAALQVGSLSITTI